MARIITVANQKGGVGKTTTAVNLSASLAAAERRVLAVDMDPQGNLSSGLGFPRDAVDDHVYHVLTGDRDLSQVRQQTELEYLQLVPSHPDLTGAEIELVEDPQRHRKLRDVLLPVAGDYDYIIVDSPPSLGLLTLNNLVAAQGVLIPLQCEYYALEGLSQLMTTIRRVQGSFNAELEIEGVLLCMYDRRMNLTRQVADEVRRHFDSQVFETVIPRNVRLGESPSFGKPVLLYDINSTGARSYLQLAQELLRRRGDRRAAEVSS
jgi:chromosome partitioning protein